MDGDRQGRIVAQCDRTVQLDRREKREHGFSYPCTRQRRILFLPWLGNHP